MKEIWAVSWDHRDWYGKSGKCWKIDKKVSVYLKTRTFPETIPPPCRYARDCRRNERVRMQINSVIVQIKAPSFVHGRDMVGVGACRGYDADQVCCITDRRKQFYNHWPLKMNTFWRSAWPQIKALSSDRLRLSYFLDQYHVKGLKSVCVYPDTSQGR